ncbi:MAG: TerB family tellurite resistance protein [Bacteroidota bacterium]
MPILDLYEHGEKRKNLAHFATLASLAAVDGEVNEKEKAILDKFAFSLNISEAEYKEVMKKENRYPIETPHSSEKRLRRLFDFFKVAFSDQVVEDEQMNLIEKYAIGLGYSPKDSKTLIQKSYDIFHGRIDFEAFQYLLDR